MIRLQQVTKRYDAFTAVHECSLHVRQGELLVLLGASGSGKSTTLKMINRLIEPTAGTIEIDGTDTQSVNPSTLRREIGYVFQEVGLFPHLSVEDNIGITPSLLGWDRARIRARVNDMLDMVELDPDGMRSRRPNELSGGQKQRVGVARALAAQPNVVLLDEPFGALDPLTRDALQQTFQKVRRESGMTAIFVTHDMVEALLLGDRIGVMQQGRLVQLGPPEELLERPVNPYVAALMDTPRRQAKALSDLSDA